MKSIWIASLLFLGCAGSVDAGDAAESSDEVRWWETPVLIKPRCELVPVTDWPSLERFLGNWVGNGVFAQLNHIGGWRFDAVSWDPAWSVASVYEEDTDVIQWGGHVLPYGGDLVDGTWLGYTTPATAEYGVACRSVTGSFAATGALGAFGGGTVRIAATGNYTYRNALYLYKEIRTDNRATVAHRLRFVRRDDAGAVVTDYMLRR